MKDIAVIYKSKYGTTRKYAEWIAEELDAEILERAQTKPSQLLSYDVIIYGGGLYAGGIGGIDIVAKNPVKSLVVFTVGLADPNITDYSAILEKNFAPDLLSKTKVFHLRGGIDYKGLGLIHKGMMAMMRKMISDKPESESSGEDELFLETYGKQIDFTDRITIKPLVDYVRAL